MECAVPTQPTLRSIGYDRNFLAFLAGPPCDGRGLSAVRIRGGRCSASSILPRKSPSLTLVVPKRGGRTATLESV